MIPKFIAFLKDTKKIADIAMIFFDGVIKTENNDFYQFEDIILMQSTGLHDKNGVEIFEGDIVKFQDELYQIEFKSYRFEAKNFWLNYQDVPDDFFSEDAYKQCEVIGNVHQHPELLEVLDD